MCQQQIRWPLFFLNFVSTLFFVCCMSLTQTASCLVYLVGSDDAPAIDIDQLYHSNKPSLTVAQDALGGEVTVDAFDPFIGTRHDEFDWLLTRVSETKSEDFLAIFWTRFLGIFELFTSPFNKFAWLFQKLVSSSSENTVLSPFLVKLLVSGSRFPPF